MTHTVGVKFRIKCAVTYNNLQLTRAWMQTFRRAWREIRQPKKSAFQIEMDKLVESKEPALSEELYKINTILYLERSKRDIAYITLIITDIRVSTLELFQKADVSIVASLESVMTKHTVHARQIPIKTGNKPKTGRDIFAYGMGTIYSFKY